MWVPISPFVSWWTSAGVVSPLSSITWVSKPNTKPKTLSIEAIFSRPRLPSGISLHILPPLFLFFAQFRSGILGAAGNHFLDLMKVTGIEDEATAQKLGVKNGDYLFMVHCGSGILGQYTMYMYTAKKREHLSTAILMNIGRFFWSTPFKQTVQLIASKIRASDFGKQEPLITFDGAGEDGKLYMAARQACSNFAHANRAVITHNVAKTIERVLGRDPEFELLYDMPHILVSQENMPERKSGCIAMAPVAPMVPLACRIIPCFARPVSRLSFRPPCLPRHICASVPTTTLQAFSPAITAPANQPKKQRDIFPTNKSELDQKLKEKGVALYNGRSIQSH
jgi:hypothetical protein